MKISTKGRYGLRILIDLAHQDNSKPRLIRDIAQTQQISEKYISRLVIALRQAGLIRSVRGVNGGFHLAKNPKEITLLEVIEVMEGPVSIVECVKYEPVCARRNLCGVRTIWQQLNGNIRSMMKEITLEDILEACRQQNGEENFFDYCI
ncbi:MAG: Rrf2 family transcriptional regulator [Lentisphaeria bacterium]|nr:Rrf2 family transcriptional regulator [Lentisphaeria bacterium]